MRLTIHHFPLHSVLQPTLGWGTCLREQWVGRLAQSKAGQALAELGKIHWELRVLRGLEVVLILVGRRNVRQRLNRHSCIASERKFGWNYKGWPPFSSRMEPKTRRGIQPDDQAASKQLKLFCAKGMALRALAL